MTLRVSLHALVTIGGFIVASCTTPYVLVREAKPNPFDGQTEFVVLPVDYGSLAPPAEVEHGVNEQFQKSLREVLADRDRTGDYDYEDPRRRHHARMH